VIRAFSEKLAGPLGELFRPLMGTFESWYFEMMSRIRSKGTLS